MSETQITIEQFVDRLLEERPLPESVNPEVLAQVKADLVNEAENRIHAGVIAELSPDELAEYEQFLDSGNVLGGQAYLSQKIPHIADVIAAALIEVRAVYLA